MSGHTCNCNGYAITGRHLQLCMDGSERRYQSGKCCYVHYYHSGSIQRYHNQYHHFVSEPAGSDYSGHQPDTDGNGNQCSCMSGHTCYGNGYAITGRHLQLFMDGSEWRY